MAISDIVKETPELVRARKMLQARARGMLPVKPSKMPDLTDQECAALALETDYTYDAIRKAFGVRV